MAKDGYAYGWLRPGVLIVWDRSQRQNNIFENFTQKVLILWAKGKRALPSGLPARKVLHGKTSEFKVCTRSLFILQAAYGSVSRIELHIEMQI